MLVKVLVQDTLALVSKTKNGLMIAGIGLILSAFGARIFVLMVLIGAVIVFTGRNAWPQTRGTAAAGMGLILIGFILSLVSFVLTLVFVLGSVFDPTVLVSLTGLLGLLVTWIGVLVLAWKITSGAFKWAIVAGFALVLIALVIAPFASTLDQFEAVFGVQLIASVIGSIGYILAGVGYIYARGKLPMPGRGASPM